MSKLNSFWTFLVALGILIFLGTTGWSIYQSLIGGDSDFNEQVERLPNDILIPEYLEDHLFVGSNIEDFDPVLDNNTFNSN